MRCCSAREILEIVMTHDQTGMLRAQADARHSRITIGIVEVNIAAHKNILIIRAARRDDKHTKDRDLEKGTSEAQHVRLFNLKSAI